jgi:hypothetical protein
MAPAAHAAPLVAARALFLWRTKLAHCVLAPAGCQCLARTRAALATGLGCHSNIRFLAESSMGMKTIYALYRAFYRFFLLHKTDRVSSGSTHSILNSKTTKLLHLARGTAMCDYGWCGWV